MTKKELYREAIKKAIPYEPLNEDEVKKEYQNKITENNLTLLKDFFLQVKSVIDIYLGYVKEKQAKISCPASIKLRDILLEESSVETAINALVQIREIRNQYYILKYKYVGIFYYPTKEERALAELLNALLKEFNLL
jgi:hypothetical protein